MKILFDYQAFYNQKIGGISRSVAFLINGFRRKNNYKVSIFTLFTFNYYFNEYQCLYRFLDSLPFYSFFKLRKFGRLLSRYFVNSKLLYFPPDIFIPTYYDCYFLNSVGETPFVITIHDMIHELVMFNDEEAKKIITKKRKLIFQSRAIIAVSNSTKNDILKIYPDVSKEKIHVVHWGNSMRKFRHLTKDIKKKNQLLFVGKRNSYKNFEWFINSIADWMIYEGFTLLCIGGDPFSDSEISLFNILKIKDKIYQKDVSDDELAIIYAESFSLIIPSLYEGFCFPIVEAMSLNCPVVYADNSCMPEVASFAGVSYHQNNQIELCQCLNKLLIDKDYYNSQVKLGILRSAEFTWLKCVFETQKVYEKCML